jgi:hypothetical protein
LFAAFGGGDVESEDACERADEKHQPDGAAQIAAEVGAERGESDRDSDEPHDLAEQLPSFALDRFAGDRRVVVGCAGRAHGVPPDSRVRGWEGPGSRVEDSVAPV